MKGRAPLRWALALLGLIVFLAVLLVSLGGEREPEYGFLRGQRSLFSEREVSREGLRTVWTYVLPRPLAEALGEARNELRADPRWLERKLYHARYFVRPTPPAELSQRATTVVIFEAGRTKKVRQMAGGEADAAACTTVSIATVGPATPIERGVAWIREKFGRRN